jgi:exosortase family protein XrtF
MISKIRNSPPALFLLKALLLYILWYLLYEFWIHPYTDIDLLVIDNIIYLSEVSLNFIGFDIIPDVYDSSFRTIGLDGTHGVWIGDSCNGITIFALFSGFIMAYPGLIKTKMWYILLGILTIHLLNIIRIMALTIILLYTPESLDFNHTYTFTTIMYVYIFYLWYLWSNNYSNQKLTVDEE